MAWGIRQFTPAMDTGQQQMSCGHLAGIQRVGEMFNVREQNLSGV